MKNILQKIHLHLLSLKKRSPELANNFVVTRVYFYLVFLPMSILILVDTSMVTIDKYNWLLHCGIMAFLVMREQFLMKKYK